MKAKLLLRRRVVLAAHMFAELVIWKLPSKVKASEHAYKYRLALVCSGTCVLRYDNEAGKGDHRHIGDREARYTFVSVDQLIHDFQHDIEQIRKENEQCKP